MSHKNINSFPLLHFSRFLLFLKNVQTSGTRNTIKSKQNNKKEALLDKLTIS